MSQQIRAIYPGSFDPVTNGHLDIIERGRSIFDHVIVAVSVNQDKSPMFTTDERIALLRDVTRQWDNVEIGSFDGLLVDYAGGMDATVILRGIRAVTDFDYEFQMALMNRRLAASIETVFLVPAEAYEYLSSSLVKEVVSLGGKVSGLLPPLVEQRLNAKIEALRKAGGDV